VVPSVLTGLILPSFQATADDAVAVAVRAEAAGLGGVFCYDHLWPMGQPERPAIAPFPLLGAIASVTARICVGTLVARVGLVPNEVLVAEFDALSVLAPGRVIAGLGTGDRLSEAENEAYGVPFASAGDRRAEMADCARSLRERGVVVWIGGGGGDAKTVAVAEAEGVVLNMWAADPEQVARQSARSEVTWAGTPPVAVGGEPDPDAISALVAQLAAAGATWAVFGWPAPIEVLAAAAASAASPDSGAGDGTSRPHREPGEQR